GIPSVKASIGQLKAGPELSYTFKLPGGVLLEPHVGLQAIWNFAGSNVIDFDSGVPTGPPGVRGRVELGVQALSTGGVGLDLSGSYDGVGSDDFQAITGRATLTVPLN
ncbi:MAG: autotransporter outer membrane beta-barrel domain-containing protein, partial [Hyphomicrobium sp.]